MRSNSRLPRALQTPQQQGKKSALLFFVSGVITLVVIINLFSGARRSEGQESAQANETSILRSVAGGNEETQATRMRVGIQAGHWKNDIMPLELDKLKWNGGASVGEVNEWEINLKVARYVGEILTEEGIMVDILPATVPEGYKADAFIVVHADGNEDTSVTGFKVESSAWDTDGRASDLRNAITKNYLEATGMEVNPTITDDMTEYYAFNFNKFNHSIAPKTPGVIVELGFLTNTKDRKMMVNSPNKLAKGIAKGILAYLGEQKQNKKRAD